MHRATARALLLALLALPGCDSLVPQGECDGEMTSVRLQYGTPDEVETGAQTQIWFYNPPQSVYFEFDWSTGTCQVTGPVAFQRTPETPGMGL